MDLSVHIEDTPIPALSASPRVVMQFEIIDATGSSRGELAGAKIENRGSQAAALPHPLR
jgi:hypothetical protein